eukprot:12149471-Karenia_brevis.AAC.1
MARVTDYGARVSALRKWNNWAELRQCPTTFAPPAYILSEWLELRAAKGPSIGPGLMAIFQWANIKLKVHFPVDSALLD